MDFHLSDWGIIAVCVTLVAGLAIVYRRMVHIEVDPKRALVKTDSDESRSPPGERHLRRRP
jgi:hypothetical protein